MKRIKPSIAMAALFAVSQILAQASRTAAVQFKAAQSKEQVEGDLKGAIEQYKTLAEGKDRGIAAKSLFRMAECYEKLGLADGQRAFERIVREFEDQPEMVAEARRRLDALSRTAYPETQTMVQRKVWQYERTTAGKASQDGRYVPFVDSSTGDLAIRDLLTGVNRRLTNDASVDSAPYQAGGQSAISRDGRQVAYQWWKNSAYELRVIGFDGSQRRVILSSPEITNVAPFDWTPDGKKILAFAQRKDLAYQIALVGVADGSVQVLKTLNWQDQDGIHISLSPDGRFIAYDVPQSVNTLDRDIFVLDTDGSNEHEVVRSPAHDYVLGWAPDGKRLLFASDRTGSVGIWSVAMSEGKAIDPPQPIKMDIGQIDSLAITRSGALLYSLSNPMRDVYIASLKDGGVAGTPARATERLVGATSAPGWSPDGKSLVYVKWRRGRADSVIVLSLDNLKERELSSELLTYLASPQWSPKGDSILVLATLIEKNRRVLATFNIASGEMKLAAQGDPENGLQNPIWSSDGNSIMYRRKRQSVELDLRTGAETVLSPQSSHYGPGDLSPDGLWQIFRVGLSPAVAVLELMNVERREARELIRWRLPRNVSSWAWSQDGQSILFVVTQDIGKKPQDRISELYLISIGGGEPKALGRFTGDMLSPRLDREGQRAAYWISQPGLSEVWALENLLPARINSRREP